MKSQIVHNGWRGIKDHPITAHHQSKACQRLHTHTHTHTHEQRERKEETEIRIDLQLIHHIKCKYIIHKHKQLHSFDAILAKRTLDGRISPNGNAVQLRQMVSFVTKPWLRSLLYNYSFKLVRQHSQGLTLTRLFTAKCSIHIIILSITLK